jgi:hypothetical protein
MRLNEFGEDFLVDDCRLQNAELDGNVPRHASRHSPQVAHQSFTMNVVERYWWNIHRGSVWKHMQQRQPGLVPSGNSCRMIQRMLRDLGQVDWTEYLCDADHASASSHRVSLPDESHGSRPHLYRNARASRISGRWEFLSTCPRSVR